MSALHLLDLPATLLPAHDGASVITTGHDGQTVTIGTLRVFTLWTSRHYALLHTHVQPDLPRLLMMLAMTLPHAPETALTVPPGRAQTLRHVEQALLHLSDPHDPLTAQFRALIARAFPHHRGPWHSPWFVTGCTAGALDLSASNPAGSLQLPLR